MSDPDGCAPRKKLSVQHRGPQDNIVTAHRAETKPREDLAEAPNLDITSASSESYNCYGNGIGKQIAANPSGYMLGDSTEKTFESVMKDLGTGNVRRLTSINDEVYANEYKVAIKCGPNDYHFIRLDGAGWYNKSGLMPGVHIDKSIVSAAVWYPIWMENGVIYSTQQVYYDDKTIYFAVKKDWYTK
jgi:hypothetical protein